MSAVELGLASAGLAFGAGLASVLSPCVLPVVPLIITGTTEEHRARPALVVAGLAASFVTMGILTALFGAVVGPLLPRLEKVVAVLLVGTGLLLLLDVNPFKRLAWLQRIEVGRGGRWSGLLLGASLGLVWIPCVGPLLSAVLATVAAEGRLATGVVLLAIYSAGFAVPMLAVGYGSQALRRRLKAIASRPLLVRAGSGLMLVAFGLVVLSQGMLFASL